MGPGFRRDDTSFGAAPQQTKTADLAARRSRDAVALRDEKPIAFSSEVDTGSREENASTQLRAVGAATAIGAEIPAARAGVQPRLRVVAAASAVGAAVPAGTAAAGDFNDVGRRRRKRRQRRGRSTAGGEQGGSKKGASKDCLHEMLSRSQ